jgi:hypothetical protein
MDTDLEEEQERDGASKIDTAMHEVLLPLP